MQSVYVDCDGISIHILDYGSDLPPLILCHGLTANAHCFEGYIEAGLTDHFRVIAVDLRGRGLSDKPEEAYRMEDHMKDLLIICDYFNWDSVILGGHSFGALLSIYTAYHHPNRVKSLILIDAAARIHPNAKEMLAPALNRLGLIWKSEEDYMNEIKKADYHYGLWDSAMYQYYKADIREIDSHKVTTQSSWRHMEQAVNEALGIGELWLKYIKGINQPTLLINAVGAYGNGEPLLPEELARETVSLMSNAQYQKVDGNHFTMMFGSGATQAVEAIVNFVIEDV